MISPLRLKVAKMYSFIDSLTYNGMEKGNTWPPYPHMNLWKSIQLKVKS